MKSCCPSEQMNDVHEHLLSIVGAGSSLPEGQATVVVAGTTWSEYVRLASDSIATVIDWSVAAERVICVA